jgi:polysaccharide export outer membrane protein
MIFKNTSLRILCLLLLTSLSWSCTTQKNIDALVYFNQPGDTALAKVVQNAEPIIQSGDRLSIVVNATNPLSVAPYNLGSAGSGAAAATAGYLVEEDGTVHFAGLGKIKVAGLKRKQLVDLLSEKLVQFVNDPIVTVQFLNFKITVLGEVGKPGTIQIPDGKVTIIDAIGLAGDLPLTARRDNIMVLRERNGQREFGRINMLSKNAFSSPYFVLQQNDVVYVELTNAKVAASDQSFSRNLSILSAIISLVTTVTFLIINAIN